jgi:hypothetical protein
MARHKRHYHGRGHHHRFGDALSLRRTLHAHVSVKDIGVGALVGLGSGLGAIYGLNKLNASRAKKGQPAIGFKVDATGNTVPAPWLPFVPALGGLVVGLGSGFVLKGKHSKRRVAVLAGSVLGGLVVSGFQYAKSRWSGQFGDYLKVRLAGYGNVLINQGALGNLLVTMPVGRAAGPASTRGNVLLKGRRASMGQLAALAISPYARATAGYMRARVG